MNAKDLIDALYPYIEQDITYTYDGHELELWTNEGEVRVITINEPNQL